MLRALTGIRSSGDLHIGNYLGTIRPALNLQEKYHCFYFIADMHALTTQRDPKLMKQYSYDIAACWMSFGLDLSKHFLYRQSDIPQVAELAWYLSCVTGVGLLDKAHAFKEASSANREVNHGTFAYPVLMAADILLYDADLVPVGKDQKQHVEMARDMAGSFNALFGECLKLPQPMIHQEVMTVPGLDGRKMSKSYGNTISIFSEEKQLRKAILSIKTDSTPIEAAKQLQGSLLGELFKLFTSQEQYLTLEKKLMQGGFGWGHAKEELFETVRNYLNPARSRYFELRKDEENLERVLTDNRDRVSQIASNVLKRVRQAQGFKV
jgi:tryptophanyl-tRNA synthetase